MRAFFRSIYSLLLIAVILAVFGLVLAEPITIETLTAVEKKATIESNLRRQMLTVNRDMVPILEQLEKNDKLLFSDFIKPSLYPYYIFKSGRLVYWSDYRFVPEYRLVRGDYKLQFRHMLRKDFLSRQWKIRNSEFEVFALIPLYTGYKIKNNYVGSSLNKRVFPFEGVKIAELDSDSGMDICLSRNCLFKAQFDNLKLGTKTRSISPWPVWLLSIALLLFVVFVYLKLKRFAKVRPVMGVLLWLTFLVLIRSIMLWFEFPHELVESAVFDSRYYASSVINPSIGDLFLNLLCLCFIALFVLKYFRSEESLLWVKGQEFKNIKMISASFVFILIFYGLYIILQLLYHNSQITFDVNQTIRFDASRLVGFAIFVVYSALVFLICHILFKYLSSITDSKLFLLLHFALAGGVLLVVQFFTEQQFLIPLAVAIGYFVILLLSGLGGTLSHLRYRTFLYIFSCIFATSVLGAIVNYQFEGVREIEMKRKFAANFLIDNDPQAEFLLNELNDKVKNDRFIQSRMSNSFGLSRSAIRDKISRFYLGSYFNKYDIQINLYNSKGQPFDKSRPAMELSFNEEDKTDYENIYFTNSIGGDVSKRYRDFIEIKNRGIITVGFIIIDLSLKRVIPENVYPELLVDSRFLQPYQHTNYSFAVYESGNITYVSGDYNYSNDFDQKLLKQDRIYKGLIITGDYRHAAVKDMERDRTIVITSDYHPFANIISNFSFLFLIQVFIVLLFTSGYALYFSLQEEDMNYSAKIQLYLNVAFFLPLFAVSITTFSLINSSFRKEVNREYNKKAESISTNVSDDLNEYTNNPMADAEELSNKLAEITRFSGVDVNLFNIKGKLIASSQPLIYANDLLSDRINPIAYSRIKELRENSFNVREAVGKLKYSTTFFGVKSFDKGELIGIVSIPFFRSEYALEQNQINVLTNVMNIFSVIFIIFLGISYFAAKWLTFPLNFITQKLKKTTLTGFNEPLSWHTDDEIGLMVGEYNRMLDNLEESKKALARSQKESAWREMAQQVAHEIKNPLTPMKLTLQHMSRKLRDGDHDVERPISTLLQQVETLDDIASSFSSFAKMPMPEHERYELTEVVRNTVNLFKSTKNADIELNLPEDELFTVGDEQLTGRIINNLMLNAIQAIKGDQVEIKVKLNKVSSNKLRLEVADNGTGIPDDIHNKIFVPNFTTKETGSGIGLAIAKHGIEHASGKIWFETEEEVGTSFFIELPIVE